MEWQTEDIPFIYSMEGSTVELHTVKFDSDNKPRLQYNSTVVLFIDTLQTEVSFNLETDDDVIVLSLVEPANYTDQNMRQRVWSDAIVVIPRDETESRMSCQRWKAEDSMLPFLSETQVQVCPCRFDQANIDVIRFHPDPLCQSQESSTRPDTNCLYHPRARQCFRLNTPGTIGTGQLCCYDNNGNLMDMLTSSGGGFLERFHYFGDGEAVVPYLSNIVFDTAPYYHCCVYPQSTLKSGVPSECYEFYQRRKTRNCKEFVPNILAQNFGDPHFVTPDGLTYTFNGVGEFVLFRTKSKTFETQVRMQPFIANNDKRGSLITSIVLKAINVSDTVEIKLNSIRTFDILINGVVQDITGITFIRYTGVTISVHDVNMTGDGHTKEVNIAFPDIGFQTLVFGSFLNYFVSFGPSIEQGSIEGLLGNFNNNPNDDLVSRAGDVLPSDSSTEHIHNNMGITWRVTAEESLFTYAVGTSHSSIQDTAYVPTFEVPQSAIDDTMRAICGNDTFCAYDYYVTNDMTVAIATQISGDTFQRIQEISRPVVTCGVPPAVEYGQWNTSGMEVGDTGQLLCNSGRQLQGSGYITCNTSGDWTDNQSSCVVPVVTCEIPPAVRVRTVEY
ncbi:sushi domain-containing protein 2-like [Argopecten irradians]|uniref:sushi domain-containing protein 2-like n=1 Tax=Argopecten irradians TaxID=31199 RepID=UPI0037198B33